MEKEIEELIRAAKTTVNAIVWQSESNDVVIEDGEGIRELVDAIEAIDLAQARAARKASKK